MELIELRPHHLLCIQGYHGVGYSDSFVDNMSQVVNSLKANPSQQIILNKKYDDICGACPEKEKGCSSCGDENLVSYLDEETLKWLGICEGTWVYRELAQYIEENLTWDVYFRICSQCEWFKNHVCALKDRLFFGEKQMKCEEK